MSELEKIKEMAKDLKSLDDVSYYPNCNYIYRRAEKLKSLGYIKQKWISVDERLPEESGIYLVFSNLGNRLILDYSARHKLFNSFDSYSTEQAKGFAIAVTHWMPLPEPPETKGEKE